MSGMEALGILLGAFPLAVSALEHYRETAKTLGLLVNFQSEWRRTLSDIKDEQTMLRLTLHILIMPMVVEGELDDEDLEKLLADPCNERWTSPDMAEALRQRLGRTCTRFMEVATELQQLTTNLLSVLGVDKPKLRAKMKIREDLEDMSTASAKEKLCAGAIKVSLQYRKEQIKFGFGKAQRDELIEEMRRKREKLDTLLEKSDKVASYHRANTTAISPKSVRSLLHYWRHAERIHRLIRQSWGCACRTKHCAHLWLQHQTSTTFEFKLLVLWSPTMAQNAPPWQPQGLCITYGKGVISQTLKNRGTAAPTRLIAATDPPSSKSALTKGTKKQRLDSAAGVRFNIGPTGAACALAGNAGAGQSSITCASTSDPDFLQEISGLCIALGACGMQPECIGSLTDLEQGNQYRVFSQPQQKVSATEITLHEVLADTTTRELTRSDRFRIALAIASSHLQLHSTPWARKQWEAHDILFPQSTQGVGTIMFDRPYVSADFNTTLPEEQRVAKQ